MSDEEAVKENYLKAIEYMKTRSNDNRKKANPPKITVSKSSLTTPISQQSSGKNSDNNDQQKEADGKHSKELTKEVIGSTSCHQKDKEGT